MSEDVAGGELRAITENPFYILGLPVHATRAEVEREGQKLASMLSLHLASAATYETPLGPRSRTEDKVRWALHELRDPAQRARHALWARLPAESRVEAEPQARPQGLPGALAAIGWDF
jgi:hypothetical protein